MTASPSEPPPGAGEEKFEGWTWTLFTNARETAVELWRDGDLRITLPLTADQAEVLMGRPVSLTGELRRDGLLGSEEE